MSVPFTFAPGDLVPAASFNANFTYLDTNKLEAGPVTTSGLTMSSGVLLGRTTASTGAVEEITIGSGLTLSAGELSATGGGGGTPGGSTTQVQYNNAGAFGGITGATTDGTTLTLVAPVLGAASATSINKVAITAPATAATLTIANNKTLTVNNTLTLTGTDATVMTLPTTSATLARTDAGQTFSGAQAFSGLVTPSAGVKGVSTNTNAAAGNVGEYISSSVPQGSAVSLTSTTAANITSISLTAGDWDVWGTVAFDLSANPTITRLQQWISSTSATVPTAPNGGGYTSNGSTGSPGTAIDAVIVSAGHTRLSLSGTTTVYLGERAVFSGTLTAYGFIGARRVQPGA